MSSRINRIRGLYLSALYADFHAQAHQHASACATAHCQSSLDYLVSATQHLIHHGSMQGLYRTLWGMYTNSYWRMGMPVAPSGDMATALLRCELGLPMQAFSTGPSDECLADILARVVPLACASADKITDEELQSASVIPTTCRVHAAVLTYLPPFQRLLAGASDDELMYALYQSLCLNRPEPSDALLIEGAFWICLSSADLASACRAAACKETRLPGLTALTAMLCGARFGGRNTEITVGGLADADTVYALAHRFAVFCVHGTISPVLSA